MFYGLRCPWPPGPQNPHVLTYNITPASLSQRVKHIKCEHVLALRPRCLLHLSHYQYRQTQSCIEQWLSLYSVKSDFNWFALLHPDHKTVNDSGFLINWLSFFGCICCCFRQKIVAFAFPLYTIVKMDISKKVLVIVGMYLKLYIAVTCLLFPMLFLIAWRVLPLLRTIVVR